jgi:hypothetical protein
VDRAGGVACVEIRDRLTEHALSTLPSDERAFVGRHLEWCAGCRKEAEELESAAAWVALSTPQSDPPSELEDRIVDAIAGAAPSRAPWRRRLRLLTVATAAALVLAIVGVGWGAAMFARVQTSEERARQAEQQSHQTIHNLQHLLNQFLGRQPAAGPREQVRRSTLAPSAGLEGGAGALVFTSPFQEDWALVIIGGLADRGRPYHVRLQDRYGRYVDVGTVRKLSSDGSARVFRTFQQSLKRFTYVLVKDRTGRIVLSGDLGGSPVRVHG